MRRFPVLLLAAVSLVAGPAPAGEARPPAESAKSVTLPANEFHEECVELARGERLGYSFRADAALEFNVHHHRGGKILYPVRKKGVTTLAGAYTSPRDDGYCLMWRNAGKRPVELQYRFGTAVGSK